MVGKLIENPADVILVPSRLAGKVRSIDCHRSYVYMYVIGCMCRDIFCACVCKTKNMADCHSIHRAYTIGGEMARSDPKHLPRDKTNNTFSSCC